MLSWVELSLGLELWDELLWQGRVPAGQAAFMSLFWSEIMLFWVRLCLSLQLWDELSSCGKDASLWARQQVSCTVGTENCSVWHQAQQQPVRVLAVLASVLRSGPGRCS